MTGEDRGYRWVQCSTSGLSGHEGKEDHKAGAEPLEEGRSATHEEIEGVQGKMQLSASFPLPDSARHRICPAYIAVWLCRSPTGLLKLDVDPQLKSVEGYEPGQQLKVEEIFKVGEKVDVAGITNGKGFQGGSHPFTYILVQLVCKAPSFSTPSIFIYEICMGIVTLSFEICLCRCHQEMEPPQRKHDSRVQVKEATWFHRIPCNAQPCFPGPEDGGSDGQ